jgi:hypothetical protein
MMLVGRTIVTKVLGIFKHSPAACSFCIMFGVGIMLSVAYLDPTETSGISYRHALGGVFLLLPGLANRLADEE